MSVAGRSVKKMALLAYLVMVALLVTSIFVSYEWIATSYVSKVSFYMPAHTKVAKHTPKAKLAALAKAKLAAASTGETEGESNLTIVNSVNPASEESAKEQSGAERRTTRVHRKRPRIIVQRAHDGTFGTVLGYADAPELRPSATFDRSNPY